MAYGIPEAIVERFRTLSLDRVATIEATWNVLIQGVIDGAAFNQMLRDIHTLKGDARVIGYVEIHTLCHKLEELMVAAHEHRYQVPEDFELVVTMAIQFLGILLRMKSGSSMSGIDIEGFVRQVDEVLHETHTVPVRRRSATARIAAEASIDRLADATRRQFAIAATTTYLEYLAARTAVSRTRLRSVWDTLRGELSRMQTTALAPLFERHANAVRNLADELGKRAALDLDVGEIRVDSRIAEAVDIAAIHLVRNAVDHGIEASDARVLAGKPAQGSVRVSAREVGATVEIVVEDDGRGIDLAAVRAKAVERGMLAPVRAASVGDADLVDLLFQSGFTTRSEATAISGRGVGLDAVKAAIVRVGGKVEIRTATGRGTTIALTIPAVARQISAYQFMTTGGSVSLAVSAHWTPSVESPPASDVIDPMRAIRLVGHNTQTGVDASGFAAGLGLRLRWGFLELSFCVGSEPVLVAADRICSTPDDHPIEIISVEGRETVLLRPEYLFDLTGRTGRGAVLLSAP